MHTLSLIPSHTDTLPLLDEEFDRVEIETAAHAGPVLPDEIAWDDQLDNGEEMSL